MSEIYKQELLKKTQIVLTDMMRQFDKLCRDNDIDYFVSYGTAIGAVRHQGFIPWDDDIDLGMMRSDYEKLKKVFETQDTGNLFLSSPDMDDEWHEKFFPKLNYRGTVYVSENWHDNFEKDGEVDGRPINFDIFLYDYCDENFMQIAKKSMSYKRNYMYTKFKAKLIRGKGLSAFVSSLVKRIMYDIHSSDKDYPKKQFRKYLKLIEHPESDYIVCYDTWTESDVKGSYIRYDESFPTVPVMFEGFEVKIQKNYDKTLRETYGDYMQLPPVDQRVAHRPYNVSFGDYKFDE